MDQENGKDRLWALLQTGWGMTLFILSMTALTVFLGLQFGPYITPTREIHSEVVELPDDGRTVTCVVLDSDSISCDWQTGR